MAAGSPGTADGREPDIILARLEVDYLRQLRYRVGERLRVRSHVLRLGTKSITVRQELTQDDEVAIRADAVMVLFDFATDSSRPLSDAERAYWSRFQTAS
jgi:acyl-CoA thioester hydrolase